MGRFQWRRCCTAYGLPSAEFKGRGKLKHHVMFAEVLRAIVGLHDTHVDVRIIVGVDEQMASRLVRAAWRGGPEIR